MLLTLSFPCNVFWMMLHRAFYLSTLMHPPSPSSWAKITVKHQDCKDLQKFTALWCPHILLKISKYKVSFLLNTTTGGGQCKRRGVKPTQVCWVQEFLTSSLLGLIYRQGKSNPAAGAPFFPWIRRSRVLMRRQSHLDNEKNQTFAHPLLFHKP